MTPTEEPSTNVTPPTEPARVSTVEKGESLQEKKAALELEKLKLEVEGLKRKWPSYLQSLVPPFSVLLGVLGLWLTFHDSIERQAEAEHHRQDELFAKAVTDLGAASNSQRTGALLALADFAKRSEERKAQVQILMIGRLETENDPDILSETIVSIASTGASSLNQLVKANRRGQSRLFDALAQYVAIELRRADAARNKQDPSDLTYAAIAIERDQINRADSPGSISELGPRSNGLSAAYFLFETRNRGDLGSYRTELTRCWYATKDSECPTSVQEAQQRVEHSKQVLFATSDSIVLVLKQSSGKLAGVDLSGIYLVDPDLSGIDLSGSQLNKVVLHHPVLSGSKFEDAKLSYAWVSCDLGERCGGDFNYADLSSAVLDENVLDHSSFVAANLNKMFLMDQPQYDSRIDDLPAGQIFDSIDLRGANWWDIRPTMGHSLEFETKEEYASRARAAEKRLAELKSRFAQEYPEETQRTERDRLLEAHKLASK